MPTEASLFDKTISFMSASVALQTAKRKEFFFSQVSVPLSAPQKRELLVSSRSGDFCLISPS